MEKVLIVVLVSAARYTYRNRVGVGRYRAHGERDL